MSAIHEDIRTHYDNYYGDEKLAQWRRLGAIDKADNIIELSRGLEVGSVLDIGCGDGAVISRLAELNFAPRYQGIDISSSAIAAAKTRKIQGLAAFERFDGSTLPFEAGQFDLAYLSHVVEHLEHPRALLYEARRVARHVIVEVPCEHTARLPRNYSPDPVGHINYYTPVTIRRLVQTCGMVVEKQLTRGCSLEAMKFHQPRVGVLQYAIREAALKVAPQIAPAIFVYHSALLCRG
jgi:ubiquinone/menaquinone biosynthesis C-methylase UbiE